MLTTERHRACKQESTFHLPLINVRIHCSFLPDYQNSKYEQFIKLLAYTFRNTVSFSSSSCSIAFASNGTFQKQSMHNCPTKQYTCFHQENKWTEQQLFTLPSLTWFVIVISSICHVSFLQSYKLEITQQLKQQTQSSNVQMRRSSCCWNRINIWQIITNKNQNFEQNMLRANRLNSSAVVSIGFRLGVSGDLGPCFGVHKFCPSPFFDKV